MLETCRGHSFLISWIKDASRWYHYTDKGIDLSTLDKIQNIYEIRWSIGPFLYLPTFSFISVEQQIPLFS
jgi:hypothetical protein